jgi:AcrR family transcriptional regulator
MPRTYSRERRAELTATTRARIVDAVRDLIVEVGPSAITLPAVAARADVALRTLYNHFPSRADLLTAALRDLAAKVSALSLDVWQADQARPREALRGYVVGVYRAYEAQAPWFEALLTITDNPELERTVAELRDQGRRTLAEIVRASDSLLVPVETAALLASIHTLYPVWRHLTRDVGLASDQAATLVADFLDRALFGPRR